MPHSYTKAGTYVAICNKTNWDGHYVKIFDFPAEENEARKINGYDEIDAGWYFLNRVDFTACLEAVYPLEIFQKAFERRNKTPDAGSDCSDRWSIGVDGKKTMEIPEHVSQSGA